MIRAPGTTEGKPNPVPHTGLWQIKLKPTSGVLGALSSLSQCPRSKATATDLLEDSIIALPNRSSHWNKVASSLSQPLAV